MNTQNNCPLVSILMASYNTDSEYLLESVNSILEQTYNNIEFIIIDDASITTVESVLKNAGINDCRIRLIRRESNVGLAKNLNYGLNLCHGKYIARMDSDDIAIKERIEKQLSVMEKHPNIDICCGYVLAFGAYSDIIGYKIFESDSYCARLLFDNWGPLHPTVMFRRDFLEQNNIKYDENYRNGQDYKLWIDTAGFAKIKCLDEVILLYRIHNCQAGTVDGGKRSFSYANEARKSQLMKISNVFTEEDYHIHFSLSIISNEIPDVNAIETYFSKLRTENNNSGYLKPASLNKELAFRWINLILRCLKKDRKKLGKFLCSREMFLCFKPHNLSYIWSSGIQEKVRRHVIYLKYKWSIH